MINVIDGTRDVDLPGWGEIEDLDWDESDVAGEFVDEFESFLNESLVGLHWVRFLDRVYIYNIFFWEVNEYLWILGWFLIKYLSSQICG